MTQRMLYKNYAVVTQHRLLPFMNDVLGALDHTKLHFRVIATRSMLLLLVVISE